MVIKKIISGAQTGADLAALARGLPTLCELPGFVTSFEQVRVDEAGFGQ